MDGHHLLPAPPLPKILATVVRYYYLLLTHSGLPRRLGGARCPGGSGGGRGGLGSATTVPKVVSRPPLILPAVEQNLKVRPRDASHDVGLPKPPSLGALNPHVCVFERGRLIGAARLSRTVPVGDSALQKSRRPPLFACEQSTKKEAQGGEIVALREGSKGKRVPAAGQKSAAQPDCTPSAPTAWASKIFNDASGGLEETPSLSESDGWE